MIVLNLYNSYMLFRAESKVRLQSLQTEMEEIKDENRIMKQNFNTLSDNLLSGVMLIDEFGTINYINASINKIFNEKITENMVVHKLENKQLKKIIIHSYGREVYVDRTVNIQDNHYRITSNPIFSDGEFIGCLLLATDVTKLVNAKVLQKEFMADVSHELKTPISAIKLASEILSRDLELDESHSNILKIINHEVNRTESLIKDIVDLSKYDRLDFQLIMDQLDIKDLIDDVLKVLSHEVYEKGLTLKANLESIQAKVDAHKIKQVLFNFIRNSIMYTDEGSIEITCKENKRKVEITIEDTGIGMTKEATEKIFERFYRADKNRSRETGGSGLGLAIAYQIINKHNGEIDVKSRVGKGTKFTITFPVDFSGNLLV